MNTSHVTLTLLFGIGLALPLVVPPTSRAEATPSPGAPAQGFELSGGDDALHGSMRTPEGGFVGFDAAVLGDHVVQVELHTGTVSAGFRADFEQGELLIEGNGGLLSPEDWRAVDEAYRALSGLERQRVNPIAALYTHRALGMMAESTPGFVWDSWDAKLPVLDASAPSFRGDAYAAAWADAEPGEDSEQLEALERFDGGGAMAAALDAPALGASVLALDPADVLVDAADLGYASSLPSTSSCGGYLTDARDGQIECVEYGKYYCIGFDMFMSKEVDVETISPAIPPWWSRAKAKTMAIPGPKALDGTYPCNGRCGPGCEDAPDWIGGGGGWAVGCLIHDHCVFQSTGGADVSSLWATTKHNIQLNPSCGDDMRAAADDHFMPPNLCPGSTTVGGSGKWYRYAPPRTDPRMTQKYDNTVSKRQTTYVGTFDVEAPSSPSGGSSTPDKRCQLDPSAPDCTGPIQ